MPVLFYVHFLFGYKMWYIKYVKRKDFVNFFFFMSAIYFFQGSYTNMFFIDPFSATQLSNKLEIS